MSRRGLLAVIDAELDRQKLVRGGKGDPLGGAGSSFAPHAPEIPDDYKQNLKWEREYCGVYLSGNPLDHVAATSIAASVGDDRMAGRIEIVGLVSEVNLRHTRTGTAWARFSISDHSGPAHCFAFGEAAKAVGDGYLGRITGELVSRDDEIQVKVFKFQLMEEW